MCSCVPQARRVKSMEAFVGASKRSTAGTQSTRSIGVSWTCPRAVSVCSKFYHVYNLLVWVAQAIAVPAELALAFTRCRNKYRRVRGTDDLVHWCKSTPDDLSTPNFADIAKYIIAAYEHRCYKPVLLVQAVCPMLGRLHQVGESEACCTPQKVFAGRCRHRCLASRAQA